MHDRHDDCLENDEVIPVRFSINLLEFHPSPVCEPDDGKASSALARHSGPYDMILGR